jgi:hypothetical protein
MSTSRTIGATAPALLLLSSVAGAASLSVVEVAAPTINCVFETDCKIVVTDSVGQIPLPNLTGGAARLQTRTFAGKAGAPAAGKFGYEYRVDLTSAVTNAEFSCVTDLTVDFGTITKLQYNNVGPADDVFVVSKGGLGKIGILVAEQAGNMVTFTFSQPICAGHAPNTGDTTFFFGLTSAFAPKSITATVGVPGLLPVDVPARGPDHPVRVAIPPIIERPVLDLNVPTTGALQPPVLPPTLPPPPEPPLPR